MEYKPSNSPEIEAFAKRLSENAKGGKGAVKKPEAASKPGETKPAADGKAESK
jgi:hypothetical protein